MKKTKTFLAALLALPLYIWAQYGDAYRFSEQYHGQLQSSDLSAQISSRPLLKTIVHENGYEEYSIKCRADSLLDEVGEGQFPVLDTLSTRERHFRLVYIDHEPTTPIIRIQQRLEKLREDAVESGSILVIYLADEQHPLLSFTNLKDPIPGESRDIEEAYSNLIRELQVQTSHELSAEADLETLKLYFGTGGIYPLFQGNSATMNFKSISLDFYVGPDFWNMHCNEDLLANLYVSLRLNERLSCIPPSILSFNVLKPRGSVLNHLKNMPFGSKNLENVNEKLKIEEY